MATEFDFELSSDPTSEATADLATLLNAIVTMLPNSKHGGLIYSPNTPSVANNPRYARYIWLDAASSSVRPVIKTYDPTDGQWKSGLISDLSITNTMLSGGITIDKLSNLVTSQAGFFVRVNSSGTGYEAVDLSTTLPTVPISALSKTGIGTNYFLKANAAGNAFVLEALTADMMPTDIDGDKITDDTIPGAKLEDNTIQNAKLASGTIEKEKMKASNHTRAMFSQYQVGILVNRQITDTTEKHVSTATTLPDVTTIPQYDGIEVADLSPTFTASYTPKKVGNILQVTVVIQANILGGSSEYGALCIAEGSGDVIAAVALNVGGSSSGSLGTHIIDYRETIAALTARTFKIVAGTVSSGVIGINVEHTGPTKLFAGKCKSSIIIEEYETP